MPAITRLTHFAIDAAELLAAAVMRWPADSPRRWRLFYRIFPRVVERGAGPFDGAIAEARETGELATFHPLIVNLERALRAAAHAAMEQPQGVNLPTEWATLYEAIDAIAPFAATEPADKPEPAPAGPSGEQGRQIEIDCARYCLTAAQREVQFGDTNQWKVLRQLAERAGDPVEQLDKNTVGNLKRRLKNETLDWLADLIVAIANTGYMLRLSPDAVQVHTK